MVFLKTGTETGGELLRIDSYNPPSAPLESEHVHPFQESGAEVISGSLRFRVGGEERSVKAGECITIPVDTPHHFWNDGEEVAHSVQWFKPNTVQLRRTTASWKGLVGWGQFRWDGFLTLNLDILRLTTRGLQRFALGASGLAATSSRSPR